MKVLIILFISLVGFQLASADWRSCVRVATDSLVGLTKKIHEKLENSKADACEKAKMIAEKNKIDIESFVDVRACIDVSKF
jgi:hypothetical protein